MAVLNWPEVFERTWTITAQPFWPQATQRVCEKSRDFCFMAEVYWDLEKERGLYLDAPPRQAHVFSLTR
jgi:hypothetical protein